MKKLIIILSILTFLLGLLTFGFFYLKETYVPKTLKALIEESVRSNTNLDIKIGSIKYELFKGVIIDDLVLTEQGKPAQIAPIAAKKIHFNILLLPAMKGKQIIIPALYIQQLKININRRQDLTWNIEHFLKQNSSSKNAALPLVILRVQTTDAKISIEDKTLLPEFSRQFSSLNLSIFPGGLNDVIFKLNSLVSDNQSQGKVTLEGKFNIKNKFITTTCLAKDLELSDVSRYFNLANTDINKLSLKNSTINLKYSFPSQDLSVNSEIELSDFDLKNFNISYQGSAKLNISTSVKSAFSSPTLSSLSGQINVFNSNIKGIEIINELQKINAKIIVKDKYIKLENFEGVWRESLLKASGILSQKGINKSSLALDINAQNLDIQKLTSLLPANSLKGIENLSGLTNCQAHLEINDISLPQEFTYTVNLDLKSVSLKLSQLELEQINGQINLDNNSAVWKNLSFSSRGLSFKSSGTVNDFKIPRIQSSLSSELFNAKADILFKDNIAEIESLNIDSLDSSLKAGGRINFKQEQPTLDAKFNINLALPNLKTWLPKSKQTLDQLNLQGIMQISANINGPVSKLDECRLSLNANSDSIKIANLNLANLKINYSQADGLVENANLTSNFYGGRINVNAKGRILAQDMNLDILADATNIALEKLKSDTTFKDKDINGDIALNVRLNARSLANEKLTGEGKIEIKNGQLWEFRPFKGLQEFLVIPEFSKVNFTDGSASFIIRDNKLYTQDLTLNGTTMTIKAIGSLGFDGGLDFEAECKFSQEYVQNSPDLRKFITNLFSQLQENLTLKITGNVKKPQYSVIPVKINVDLLKPLKDIFNPGSP
jgi:hypothetical protein